MEIPALRQLQHGNEVFVCNLGREVLGDPERVQADEYKPGNPGGYQRQKSPARARAFAKYLLATGRTADAAGVCANSLVLNAREGVTFKPVDGDYGLLELGNTVLWEVDGQHRIYGFQLALHEAPWKMEDFKFPAVITNGLNRVQEALVFYLINTEQKRVPTDLSQRLISENLADTELGRKLLEDGKDWKSEGLKIIDQLNQVPNQPWFQQISSPGGLKQAFVSQNTFLTSLRPILTQAPFRNMTREEIVTLLVRYWSAIADVVPDCFKDGAQKNFAIQKTTGVSALHAILPDVVDHVRRSGSVTREGLRDVLRCVLDEHASYWHIRNDEGATTFGSSHKGVRLLASRLRHKLPRDDGGILL